MLEGFSAGYSVHGSQETFCIRRKGFFRFLSSPAATPNNTQPPESTATIRHLEKTTKHLEKIRKHLEKTTRHLVSQPPTRGETGRAPQTENHADRDQPTFSTKNPAPSLSYLFLSFFIEEKSYHNNNDRRWKRWKTGGKFRAAGKTPVEAKVEKLRINALSPPPFPHGPFRRSFFPYGLAQLDYRVFEFGVA